MGHVDHKSSSSTACPRVEILSSEAPHNAVKAEQLSVLVGKSCLLQDTEVTIAENLRTEVVRNPLGEEKQVKSGLCYGLVGPNGCGKSTVLKLIAQRGLPVPRCWDVFYVGQQLQHQEGSTPVEEVLNGSAERMALLKLAETLEAEIASLVSFEESGDAIEVASNRLLEVNNELVRWDKEEQAIEKILVGLGFRREHTQDLKQSSDKTTNPTISTPISTLSGGWRMRVQLAKALWLQPKLLLLDEPTNHLDVHALLWLEDTLKEYPHTAVVVSHDVGFLHSTCSEILWIHERKIESMPRDAVTQEDLARMQRRKALKFRFKCADEPEKHGLSFHDVAFDYHENPSNNKRWTPLLQLKGNVRLTGKSRGILLGRNGSGKSTFVELCTGSLKPLRGAVDRTQDLKIGHYCQDTNILDQCHMPPAMYLLRDHREALENRAGIGASDRRLLEEARAVLSPFGIENELAVGIPTLQLSGGQKVCVKFAVLSLYPAHILIFDEPTNHLDAAGRESLARGLADFQGGVLIVTHDNDLIYKLVECNRAEAELLVCQDGHVRREREWGNHRLHTLRDEVRRSEEADAVVAAKEADTSKGAKSKPAKLRVGRKYVPSATGPPATAKFEPTTPPGFKRVYPKFKSPDFSDCSDAPVESKRCLVHQNVSSLPKAVIGNHHQRQDRCGTEAPLTVESGPQESWKDPAAEAMTGLSLDENAQRLASHREKRIRNLKKKLQQISKLKLCSGSLGAEALTKIASETDIIRELGCLENGEEVPCAEPKEDVLATALSETEATRVEAKWVLSETELSSLECPLKEAVPDRTGIPTFAANDDEQRTFGDLAASNVSVGTEHDDILPDSWEELVDDSEKPDVNHLGIDAPKSSESCAEIAARAELVADVIDESNADNAHTVETRVKPHVSASSGIVENMQDDDEDAMQVLTSTTGNSRSHHSRFRKDLVNLNKAVSKWLKQEECGTITRSMIVESILRSPPAQHLKSASIGFQEDRFVHDVLLRAQRQRCSHGAEP